ncbi:hypothetical protein Tco_1218655 [Tanacetum coccineum]
MEERYSGAPYGRDDTTSRGESVSKTDERIDKLADQISTLVEIVSKKVVTPAPVKACFASTGTYNQVNPPNHASNYMAPPGFTPVQNNGQNRFNQNQGQGNNFNRGNNFHGNQGFQASNNHAPNFQNQGPITHALNFQNQGFQNPPFQAHNNQVQQGIPNEFLAYAKANESLMRNLQSQINELRGNFSKQEENLRRNLGNDMRSILGSFFQNQASTSGTLPSNTIPNPKGEMKAITTRSGVAYEGPSIPTNPFLKRLWTRNEKMDKDKEQSNFQGSTAHIPPPVNPIPIPEPDVLKTLPKLNIPYPSRRNDQKSRDKASNQIEKIFQIFQDLRFDTSFADALLLMPRFAPTIRNLPHDKEKLREFAKIKSIEICRRCSSKSFPKSWRSGKFLFHVISENDVCSRLGRSRASINLCPFSIVGKKPILEFLSFLGRSFLRTSRALINVFEGELILRDGNEQIIFHDDGISKHPQKHVNESIKMVNDTCEDSFEETNNLSSDSTTPLSDFHPSLESFETSKSLLERFTDEPALVCLPLPKDDDVEKEKQEVKNIAEPTAKRQTRITPCLKNFKDNFLSFSNDNSILKEDVKEENFRIYSNPLFEFDDNYNSSDINPLFKEMLEDVESKDSNVSNFDEPVLLNTPLFNEDECFDPGGDNDEIDAFLAIEISTYIEEGYYDSEGDVFYLERLLIDDTAHNFFPEVLFDHEPQCFKDESELDTLKNMVKVFYPGIWEKTFSPSCVRLSSKDHHYLFFTIVVQILFTHHVNFLFSFGSEDTIFDPGIFAFHFSSQEPVAVKCLMEFCFSTCFIPKDE